MPTVFDKLNLGDAREVVVLNAPDSFEPLLASLAGVRIHRRAVRGFRMQFGIAFAITQAQVDTAAQTMASHSDGDVTLWMAYPKQSSKKFTCEFNRDNGWAALGALGFEPVRMVAIDEDWSALRFRRAEFIKSLTRGAQSALSTVGKARAGMIGKPASRPSDSGRAAPHAIGATRKG